MNKPFKYLLGSIAIALIILGGLALVDNRVRAGDEKAWRAAQSDTAWLPADIATRVQDVVNPCSDSMTVGRLDWVALSSTSPGDWVGGVSERLIEDGWIATEGSPPQRFEKTFDGRVVEIVLNYPSEGLGEGVIASQILTPNAWWC